MMFNTKQTELDQALSACKPLVKYLILISCVANLLNLAMPLYTMQVYDRVLSSGNTNTLLMLTLVVILALTLLATIQIGRSLLVANVGSWLEKQLSQTVIDQAITQTLSIKNYACDQALRDLKIFKSFISGRSVIIILDIPWSIIFIIALFILHPYLGFISIFACITMIGLAFISDKLTQSLLAQIEAMSIKNMGNIERSAQRIELLNTMRIQQNIINNWDKLNKQIHPLEKILIKKRVVIAEVIRYFRMLLQISIIGLSTYLVLKYELSSGAIIASSVLFGRALAPFEQIIISWKEWINCKKSYSRLNMILQKPPLLPQIINPVKTSPEIITVDNLHFTFPGERKYVLKEITFQLIPGETLVIMGPTASGKSTLGKILVGIWQPSIGTIKINDLNLSYQTKNDIADHFGYLPQQLTLFNGTIMENIARMDKNKKETKVIAITKLLGIHDFILKLPHGYHTFVGPNGLHLTEGQKQLLSLARAFYDLPSLLVLDEPSSCLDYHGKTLLHQALTIAKEKKLTTIIISNQHDLVKLADKILILQNGAVNFWGAPKKAPSYIKNIILQPNKKRAKPKLHQNAQSTLTN